MSDDAKLQKVSLGPDWIDLSFGEPKLVMSALFRQLNRVGNTFKMPDFYDLPGWEYQAAAGKEDLVAILENKYDAKVVVCNGAKQALAAAMYSFKKSGCNTIHYDRPYYPANPSLATSVGLTWSPKEGSDSFLVTSPNNPCGSVIPNSDIIRTKCMGPTIHDAAYYTPVYQPDGEIELPLGDIQIYSMSKMYGVSGLRIGYAVIHNEKYYKDVVDFIEMTTAGVSTASQDIARNIESYFQQNPNYYKEFVKEAREAIAASRRELDRLDPDVLKPFPCQSNSMFGWFQAGPALNAAAAKVYILPGELFGLPGAMRMNIAHPVKVIREAVDRLNTSKIRS